MRPSSSTSSVIVLPPNPVWVMTTSTISVVPLRATRGVLTRPIWMSRDSVSCPTPTVKTGTPCDLSARSDSPSASSAVSAPSLTTTRPASGRPASSCRAPSRAAPSRVCGAGERQVVFGIDPRGGGREPERAHHEFIGQRFQRCRDRRAKFLSDKRRAWTVLVIGNLHAARIVEQHGEKVLLRNRGLDDEHGPEQAQRHESDQRDAQAGEDEAVARPQLGAAPAIGGNRHDDRSAASPAARYEPLHAANRSSPCEKTTGRYSKSSWKRLSNKNDWRAHAQPLKLPGYRIRRPLPDSTRLRRWPGSEGLSTGARQ